MPEEINRMDTDFITDYFFTTTEWVGENLQKAGILNGCIFFVGNVMIDTLLANMPQLKKQCYGVSLTSKKNEYLTMNMHRPANLDEEQKLKAYMITISENVQELPVIFPMHPRTKQILEKAEITAPNIHPVKPLGYLEFNCLVKHSKAVITDSGGAYKVRK